MRLISLFAAFGLVVTAGTAFAQAPMPRDLALSSTAFADGSVIPDKYTQQNGPTFVSPELKWTDAPAGVVSYVLWMHDPDTALKKTTTEVLHWLAFNIPGTATGLPEGVPTMAQLPDGTIQPNNISGKPGFLGPGAPHNVYHHYTWELFALDTKLSLGADASLDDVFKAMDGHILSKAVLEGRFHKH